MYRTVGLIVLLFLIPAQRTLAADAGITPYGDYCKECAIYGTCREVIPPREALIAIEKYYAEKGYTLGNVYYRGRFIEAEIYKDTRKVDKVIFDRKTGRLRSMY